MRISNLSSTHDLLIFAKRFARASVYTYTRLIACCVRCTIRPEDARPIHRHVAHIKGNTAFRRYHYFGAMVRLNDNRAGDSHRFKFHFRRILYPSTLRGRCTHRYLASRPFYVACLYPVVVTAINRTLPSSYKSNCSAVVSARRGACTPLVIRILRRQTERKRERETEGGTVLNTEIK